LFATTTATIAETIGSRAFRPVRAINAAVIDSVMTGVAHRLAAGPIMRKKQLADCYDSLLKNMKYRDAVETGTSQESNVTQRLQLAAEAFSTVK
jgi:hypothetical protein